jgi:regulator of sigma E protease
VTVLGSFFSSVGPWVLAFLGFSVLIILHELGHFTLAKLTGMRVERFSLFFPPLIVRKQWGETEYAIGATPVGGYVKISGMNPEEELPPDVAPRAYYNQPVWKRIVVIAAGPAMSILTAFVIFFVLAFSADKLSTGVLKVQSDLPAHNVLEPGDKIVSVDGETGKPGDVEDQLIAFRRQISSHKCAGRQVPGCTAKTPAVLRVERGGQVVAVRIRPQYDAAARRTILGIQFGEPRHPDAPEAASLAGTQMWRITTASVGVFVRLFQAQERKKVSGVVGSYEVTRQSFAESARLAIAVLGIISLSLGIINLFPFLPLDGGHIFWSLVEKIRGRPVPYRVMEQAGLLGFMLVIFLFFIGLSNDIGRLSGGGFDTR